MYDIYPAWKRRCDGLGISISELCRLTNTNRDTIERLKHHLPKSLENYLNIEEKLSELEAAKELEGVDS